MPRYLPIRSPFYAQWERWPYTRGPNYTRAMFREQGRGGNFTAQPMNRMPPLLGIGYVGVGDITTAQAQQCDQQCEQGCTNSSGDLDTTCYTNCVQECVKKFSPVVVTPDPATPGTTRTGTTVVCTDVCAGKTGADYTKCVKDCGTGKDVPVVQAGFFSDFWSNSTKMIGTLAVVGVAMWWMANRKEHAVANNGQPKFGTREWHLRYGRRKGERFFGPPWILQVDVREGLGLDASEIIPAAHAPLMSREDQPSLDSFTLTFSYDTKEEAYEAAERIKSINSGLYTSIDPTRKRS